MSLFDRVLDLFDRHKYGIVGTLMLHTLLVLVLLAGRVPDQAPTKLTDPILLVMESDVPEPMPEQQQPVEAPAMPGEVTNIASNITAEAIPRAAREYLAKSVEEELMDLERTEFERLADQRRAEGKEITVPELDPSKFDKERYMEKRAKPVKVEGLTTVSYDLVGRSDVRLDVPAYLCKGSGRVVVRVAVDRNGTVTRAELDLASTNTVDGCMVEHALSSASTARFSRALTAPQPQRGTITYLFLAQ